jgi:hypothetical protein
LKADGHDVSEAAALLDTFLKSQSMHEAHRENILKELGKGSA